MKEVPRKDEEEVGGGIVYRPPPQNYPPMPGGPIEGPVPAPGDPAIPSP